MSLKPSSARITVVENIYYQNPEEDAFHISSVYEESVKTVEEQPYQRTYKIGPDLTPVDFGWIAECGLVHIRNRSKDNEAFISYGNKSEGFRIPSNSSTRLYPTDPASLQICSATPEKELKVTVTIFPR